MQNVHVATAYFVFILARFFGFLIARKSLKKFEPRVTAGLYDSDLAGSNDHEANM
jgi:hypothetical protein